MSVHLSQIAEAATRSRAQLALDLSESLEGIRVTGTKIVDVREMSIARADSELIVQRVYVESTDSGDLKSVGWIINEGIDCCLVCSRKFSTFFCWRHHCRTCGLIICDSCTRGQFHIDGKKDVGPQRMCKSCNATKDKTVALKDNTQWGKRVGIVGSGTGNALPMEPAPVATPGTPGRAAVPIPSTPATNNRAPAPSTAIRSAPPVTPAESVAGSPGGLKPNPINELWTYGAVRIRHVVPAFLFQASREDRSIVFINVCESEYVPRRESNEEALYLTVGDRGVTEDGQSVYTVVVHPSVTKKFLEPSTSPTARREVCEQILLGLMRVNLESQFSIFYILPDSYTYKERVLSDTDKDALEMDILTLKATMSDDKWATTVSDPLVVAVVPSIAAFFHLRQAHANRNDLTRPGEKLAAQWNKYSHIVMEADGTLTSTSSALIGHKGSAFNMFRSPGKSRSNSLVECVRPSELRVEMRKQGVKVLVRGTISIPVMSGYSIEAPSTVPEFEGSLLDECSGTDLEDGSQAGEQANPARVVVINVLHHQVIDDLIAMGVVKGEGSEPALLLCDAPVSMTRPNGRACKVYNVAVETGHLKSGEVVGGKVTDMRISQIISKVNKHFHETADEAQFILSPIDTAFAVKSAKTSGAPASGKATKPADLRSERHMTLVLYEYVVQSSATPASKGGLAKMPSFSSQTSLASYSSFSFGDQDEVFVGFTSALPSGSSAKLPVGAAPLKAPSGRAGAAAAEEQPQAQAQAQAQARPPLNNKSLSWKGPSAAPAGATSSGKISPNEEGRPGMVRRRSVGSTTATAVPSTPAKGAAAEVAATPDVKGDKKKSWISRRLSVKKV